MGQGSERQPSGRGQERLGRYRLAGKLFDGALGDLWLGQIAEGDGESDAVWIRRVTLGPEVGDDAARGLVEAAREAQKIEHEGLHPVLDVLRTESEIAIVSRAVEGETLRAVLWRAGIKRQPIPASIALRIGLDLIEATAALRRSKTPTGRLTAGIGADNVVLSAEGRPLLLEPIVSGFAAASEPWGKDPKLACYRAPETLRDGAKVDERADVFSAAVLLWEMLRNRPLFGGAKFEAVERSIVQGSIGRVDSLRPPGGEAISKALADAVGRALERDPITRPRTLEAYAREVEKAAHSVARRDGVAAFLENAAAESLSRQRALGAAEGPPSEAVTLEVQVPLRSEPPPRKQGAAASPEADEPGAGAAAGAGVPNFGELFGAPDADVAADGHGAVGKPKMPPPPPRRQAGAPAKPEAPDHDASDASAKAKAGERAEEQDAGEVLEAGAEPPSEKLKPGAGADDEPAEPAESDGGEKAPADAAAEGDGAADEGEDAKAEAAEDASSYRPPVEGGAGGKGLWLLLAALVAGGVGLWLWAPWSGDAPATPPSTPTAVAEGEPSAPSSSSAPATEPDASASAEPVDASEAPEPDASADAAAEEEPVASAEPEAPAAPKPTGKKPSGGGKPKGRYMPGTL